MKRYPRKTYQHVKPKPISNDIQKRILPSPTAAITSNADEPRTFWQRFSSNLSYTKYLIIILFIPPILNFGALQREAQALMPKGEKVDMGWGQKMYIHCKGTGLPTVILDAPTGTSSDIWMFVHEQLSQMTQVCVYDRSGIGNSDPAFNELSTDRDFVNDRRFVAQPATLSQMTSDLHHLIKSTHPLPYPFVLVGAEVGSLIARMYSLLYTEDVSDIVLVDPLVETLFLENTEWKEYWYTKLLPSYESLHLSAILGISRLALLVGLLQPTFFEQNVPDDVLYRQKSLLCNPRHMNSAFNEYLFMNMSFLQMSETRLMKPFPKVVSVSVINRESPAEISSELHQLWNKSQMFLVNDLHQNCRSRVVPDEKFLNLYGGSSPIIDEVKHIVTRFRQKYGQLPAFAQ